MLKRLLGNLGIGKREKEFERLNLQMLEFSNAFSAITDVSELVPATIGKIRDVMGVNEATLFLHDSVGARFDLVFHRNIDLNPKLRLRGDYYFTQDDKFIRWLLTNRKPFVMSEMHDVLAYISEEERDILRFINAELCLGLEAHHRFVGIICLGRRIDGRDFDETDNKLLTVIAAQAALAIENNRLQQNAIEQMRAKKELEIAGELQRRLLPSVFNQHNEKLEIAAFCIPSSEVGGDYFDFIKLSKDKMAMVIGDVAGHGMSAGMLMAMAKSCVNVAARLEHDVSKVINSLNDMIYDLDERKALMTCIYGVVNTVESTFKYSNAGHIYPFVYRAANDEIEVFESESYPLGVRKNSDFPVREIKLSPGDFVLTCSDGLIEGTNIKGQEFGYERFQETVYKHRKLETNSLLEEIRNDFFAFLDGAWHKDDLTLQIVRLRD